METLRPGRCGHASLAYLLAGLAATAVFFALPSVAVQNVAYDMIGLSAVAAILAGIWYHRPERRLPWCLLALGDALTVTGDMLWTFDENVRRVETPFPSFADVLYLASYVAFFFGVLLLIRAPSREEDRAAAIDTAIITVGLGAMLWTFLIAPHLADAARPLVARLIAGAYPAVDLLILAAAARLTLGLARHTVALRLLILSMACTFAADIAFALLTAQGRYQTGHLVDAGWLVAYVLHGTVALHPSMRTRLAATATRNADLLRGRLPLLALAALTGPALLAIQSLRDEPVDVPVVVGTSAILILLALLRLRLLAEALRQREAHFRALVQHASDGAVIARADGTALYLSPAVAEIIGFRPEELVGRDIFARVHPDDVAEAQRLFAALLDEPGGTRTGQVRTRHADGRWRDLEVRGTNLLGAPAVGGIVLNYRDSTERVRDQQAKQFLARASEQLAASLDFDATLGVIAPLVVPAFADWCIIDLCNDDGAPERAVVYHADPALAAVAHELRGRKLTCGRPPIAASLVRSQHDHPEGAAVPDLVADVAGEPSQSDCYRALGVGAYLMTPLRTGSRTLGVLTIGSADPARRYDARDCALIEDLARRAALALDNTSLHRTLAAREYQLHDLVGRLLQQQEEERRRTAYDIHDGLAQFAASIHQHVQAFDYQHQPRPPQAQRDLDRILAVTQQMVQEARRIVANLRPIALDDFGLGVALHRQVVHLRANGWQITYDDGLEGVRLPPALETALYRVAQEALNNVRKHAKTRQVTIALGRTEDSVSLQVRDKGVGFAPDATRDIEVPGERIGLRGMHERVVVLGGTFNVISRPGEGTQILATIPLPPPHP